MKTIDSFKGDYAFLSNFYPSEVELGIYTYPTVEHAYQAAKTLGAKQRLEIGNAKTPGQAKRLGRKVTLRPDWEEEKLQIMLILLQHKFDHKDLRQELLATDPMLLIEGNTWGDMYWGVCDGVGKNMLGQLLMYVRLEIKIFGRGHFVGCSDCTTSPCYRHGGI